MRYFDLHCDTMTECCLRDIPLRKNDLHVDLERAALFTTYAQCFAVWIPDTLRGGEAYRRFCEIADRFCRETEQNCGCLEQCCNPGDLACAESREKHAAILTVENGAALGGELSRIGEFRKRGVKMCTLTWNGENELGRGVLSPGNTGLTPFGREAVRCMEDAGIVVDISHASPELFWDVTDMARKPFVASHSNSKSLCSHPRNLTDGQFLAIRDRGGLVGLNFYSGFLNDDPEKASMEDILRHAEHFLSLGGEDTVAMGGDFDGATLPADMAAGLGSVPALYELFLRHNYDENLLDKLFYSNAAHFFCKHDLL